MGSPALRGPGATDVDEGRVACSSRQHACASAEANLRRAARSRARARADAHDRGDKVFATIRVRAWWNDKLGVFRIGHMFGLAVRDKGSERTATIQMTA